MAEDPESIDDVSGEAADIVEEDDTASVFSKAEIIETIRERFRMKHVGDQKRLISGYKRTVDRRQFLKLLGYTAGTAVAAAGAGHLMGRKLYFDDPFTGKVSSMPGVSQVRGDATAEDHGDYTEVTLHDHVVNIFLEDGATFENVLFRLNGNVPNFQCRQNNWTIRNVGFDGIFPDTESVGTFFSAASGGNGLIENIYMGDGGAGNWPDKHGGGRDTQPTGIFTFNSPSGGEIVVRSLNAGPFTDNTFYCEHQGATIDMHFEDVYVHGGAISAFRVGNGSHTMTNCHTENMGYRMEYQDHGGMRDIWLRTGNPTMHVRDSHLSTDGAGIIADSGPVILEDTEWGGGGRGNIREESGTGRNPSPSPPDSVPADAMAAATGEGGGRSPWDDDDPSDDTEDSPWDGIDDEDDEADDLTMPDDGLHPPC